MIRFPFTHEAISCLLLYREPFTSFDVICPFNSIVTFSPLQTAVM